MGANIFLEGKGQARRLGAAPGSVDRVADDRSRNTGQHGGLEGGQEIGAQGQMPPESMETVPPGPASKLGKDVPS